MDLIVPCIGMKRLTSQSRTPTTTRTVSICSKGIWHLLLFAGGPVWSASASDPYLPDLFLGDFLFRVETSNLAEAGARIALLITISFAVIPFP
jgi:hypothetical protein